MSNLPQISVTKAAYLTLHYRLASMDGSDIVSTFQDNPATLQLGTGQLAPFLEECLMGLPEGVHQTFELSPEKAFGPRNPELIQWVSRATLDQNSQHGEQYTVGDVVEFTAPAGGRFAGVLREVNDEGALFDFNHPLAGQTIKFEVKIIGILWASQCICKVLSSCFNSIAVTMSLIEMILFAKRIAQSRSLGLKNGK